MLFVTTARTIPLSCNGGQAPIVHMQPTFMLWSLVLASFTRRRWRSPFLTRRQVRGVSSGPAEPDQIDWNAVASTDFQSPAAKTPSE